jgi:hypothetical protein
MGRVLPRLLGFRPAGQPFRQTGAAPPRLERRAASTDRSLLPWAWSSFRSRGSPDPGRHSWRPIRSWAFASRRSARCATASVDATDSADDAKAPFSVLESLEGLPTRRCSRSGLRPCMRFRTVRETPAGLVRRVPMPGRHVRRDLSRFVSLLTPSGVVSRQPEPMLTNRWLKYRTHEPYGLHPMTQGASRAGRVKPWVRDSSTGQYWVQSLPF